MRRAVLALFLLVVVTGTLQAGPRPVPVEQRVLEGRIVLSAELRGAEEPPSVSTLGNGTFRAQLSDDGTALEYVLSYSDLQGNVLQSHIHLGQKGVNGGIAAFLCTNLGNGPAGTPLCPGPNAGTVTGTIAAAQIVGGATAQGLTPGEFEEFLRRIDDSVTYVNVHSSMWTGGEIRGQIQVGAEGAAPPQQPQN